MGLVPETTVSSGPGADAPDPTVVSRPPGADEPWPGLAAPTVLEVLRRLDSGPRGLTEAQAEERLARWGENTLPARNEASWPVLFVRSLRDPFTAVLGCLGLVSAVVSAWGTASVILLLVVVSCVLRASGEHRADRSMARLRKLVANTATVLRRANEDAAPTAREVLVEDLVRGDVVMLGPGDLVPADVRLLRARGLTVHQAALTGESAPVEKYADDSPRAKSKVGNSTSRSCASRAAASPPAVLPRSSPPPARIRASPQPTATVRAERRRARSIAPCTVSRGS